MCLCVISVHLKAITVTLLCELFCFVNILQAVYKNYTLYDHTLVVIQRVLDCPFSDNIIFIVQQTETAIRALVRSFLVLYS